MVTTTFSPVLQKKKQMNKTLEVSKINTKSRLPQRMSGTIDISISYQLPNLDNLIHSSTQQEAISLCPNLPIFIDWLKRQGGYSVNNLWHKFRQTVCWQITLEN